MPWGPPTGEAPAEAAPPPSPAGWGPPTEEPKEQPVETKGWGPPPSESEERMPGSFEALSQGFKAGLGDVSKTKQALSGEQPQVDQETSPAAKPYDWSDLTSPISRGLPKTLYGLAKSSPTLAAGVAGGVGGSAIGPWGTVAGGTLGAAGGAALQTIGPVFAQELKKNPNDPDGAWNRAVEEATISGAASGASWALFPVRFFQGPLKNLAFQAFGIQPGVSMAEQATKNVTQGRDATEGLGQAYVQGAVGTAVPAIGQHAISRMINGVAPSQNPVIGPPKPGISDKIENIPFVGEKIKSAIDSYKESFQPELVSDLALQSQGVMRKYVAGTAQQRDALYHSEAKMHDFFERMSPQENIDFMKMAAGETPRAPLTTVRGNIPPELKPAYDHFRELLDMDHKMSTNLGAHLGYIQDYFPRQYKNPEKVAAWVEARIAEMSQQMGPTWFKKKRTFDWLQDALDAGFELKYPNASDAVVGRLLNGIDLRQRTTLLRELSDIGAAANITSPADVARYTQAGWEVVKSPVGAQYAVHPDVAPMWKNVINSEGLWSKDGRVGDVFRGWMGLKNAWVPLKLGLSLFHPLHVSHINLVDGMARGWNQIRAGDLGGALKSVGKGLYGQFQAAIPGVPMEAKRAREAWLTPEWKQTPEQKGLVKMMVDGGFSPQLSEQLRMKGLRSFNDALANSNWLKLVPTALYEGLRHTQGLIFEKWIPTLKTAAYIDGARDVMTRNPHLLNDPVQYKAALGEVAKSVDNRFGEMFYSNLYWNKTIKDAGIASFLSLGWNLGFLREFGGGMLEPLIKPLVDQSPTRQAMSLAKNKTSFALLYFANAMILNALMTKGLSGENPEGMDYFLPRLGGNNPDGSPRRLSNMFYTREVPMAKKHIEERGGAPIAGLREMIWNKMMFEPVKEIMQNKDYYGFQIMDENAPWYKQYGQMIKFILSDQLNPITISGAKRSLQTAGKWNEDDTPLQKLKKLATEPEAQLSFLGFGPAPAYASKTTAQNRLNFLFGEYVSPVQRPAEDKEVMDKRRDARAQYMMAMQNKDQDGLAKAASRLSELGVKTDQIRKIQPGNSDLYLYQRLPQKVQASFLKELDKDDFKRYYPKSNRLTKQDPEILRMRERYYRSQ